MSETKQPQSRPDSPRADNRRVPKQEPIARVPLNRREVSAPQGGQRNS